jgi:hypothetical protein
VAAGRRRQFFLAELLFADSGATMALGRSAPMLMSASPGRAAAMVPAPVEGRQLPGHRQRSPKNKAAADQPPWLRLFNIECHSNGRLRVSNWIMQGLYDYAVNNTVELSLLTAFQHIADPVA